MSKTLIIMAIAKVTGCDMKRIQFTVDLLPTDISGIQSYTPGKGFEVMKGPIFSNFIVSCLFFRRSNKITGLINAFILTYIYEKNEIFIFVRN